MPGIYVKMALKDYRVPSRPRLKAVAWKAHSPGLLYYYTVGRCSVTDFSCLGANPQSAPPSCGCRPFIAPGFAWPGSPGIRPPDWLGHRSWPSQHGGRHSQNWLTEVKTWIYTHSAAKLYYILYTKLLDMDSMDINIIGENYRDLVFDIYHYELTKCWHSALAKTTSKVNKYCCQT